MDQDLAIVHLKSSFLIEPDGLRIDTMLLDMYPSGESFLVIIGIDRDHCLHDYGAVIDALADEKHCASGDTDAVGERLPGRIDTGESRTKSRVDIHDPVGKRPQHHRREQPHEPGAGDELNFARRERIDQGAIEVLALMEVAVTDHLKINPMAEGTLESARVGAVGDNKANIGPQLVTRNRVDNCLQVGALTRDEDA